MNPLARELNEIIKAGNPHIAKLLSDVGRNLFFPKGILSQSAEAKEKAHTINATIGIAKQGADVMYLPSVMNMIQGLTPEETITYAPSFGIPALRQQWQKEIYDKNPSLGDCQISLPVVTCGITHAISILADVWTDPGDVVILPDMMWGNYNMILGVRHGVRISQYKLFNNTGGFNLDAFEIRLKEEARKNDKLIVLMNFPHNPTGYTATEAEGEALADIMTDIADAGTNVIVACDDSYFGLFYDDSAMKESLFTKLCNRHEQLLAIKLDGATKENYVWGLRVGFLTYGCGMPDPVDVLGALEKKTAGCVRGNISNASHLSQSITLKSLQSPDYQAEKEEKRNILAARATRVKAVLENEKYKDAWDVHPFNSGYFMCLKLKTVNAETLRGHLLNKYGVGLIAIDDKNLRVAFSCLEEADVEKLFDTIFKCIQDLKA
jgi:aspartate/methionine/tyrosine aminotransferase